MTALPTFTIKEMIDCGVHYGHKAMRWNPEMAPYIYGTKDGVHIIDLQQTASFLYRALQVVQDVAKRNGKILFVGTKRQASEHIKEAAKRCGQFYVDKRWLGGTLTNWKTVSRSIKTLYDLEKTIAGSESGEGIKLSKKELLDMQRKCQKLEDSLGGIREMNGKPDLVFVIDTNKENLAISESQKLGIPIVAIVDSNSYPHNIDYIIPGNDDATRSITFYCQMISDAALSGIEHSLISSGVDVRKGISKFSNEKEAFEEINFTEKSETKNKKSVSVLTKAEAVSEAKYFAAKQDLKISSDEEVITAPAIVAVNSEKNPEVKKLSTKVKVDDSAEKIDEKKSKVAAKKVVEKKAPAVKKAAEKSEEKPVVAGKKKKTV
jgi:small subunit ribosomal protein S2